MSKLKSTFLSSIRPFFDAESDRRAAAQVERDKIKVTSSKKPDVKEEEVEDDTDTNKEDDKKKPEKGEDDNKEGDEDSEKDDEAEGEEGEEKEEVKEEVSPEVAKLNKTIERLQRRVGKTTGEKAAIAKELQDAKVALAAKAADGEGLTEEEVERRAEIKADQKAANRAFETAQAKLLRDAIKIDKEFKTKINEIAEEVGAIPGAMIGVLEDLDNGGAVLAYLADNPDDYEEIIGLNIARMSNRLNRLSDKLLEEAKPVKKKLSKVPAPLEPIRGGSESPTVLPTNPTKDKESMEKFVKLRNQQELERRKLKYGY